MYSEFRRDPYFLQKYYLKSFFILVFLVATITSLYTINTFKDFYYWLPICFLFCSSSFVSILIGFIISLALCLFKGTGLTFISVTMLILLGLYIGIWTNVLIHNASHSLIGPKWFNRLVGEITGIQLLSGFPGFAIIHLEHHRHSDDLEKDPHPNPPGMGFWQYINETRLQLRKCFSRLYKEQWGENEKYKRSWKRVRPLLPLNRALRAMLLLVIFGPEVFTFCFIVSHIATQLAFGVINFYSHKRKEDGSVEIINLDYNIFYKLLNRVFSGAFYHKNHHLKPNLFNPMEGNFNE